MVIIFLNRRRVCGKQQHETLRGLCFVDVQFNSEAGMSANDMARLEE